MNAFESLTMQSSVTKLDLVIEKIYDLLEDMTPVDGKITFDDSEFASLLGVASESRDELKKIVDENNKWPKVESES